MKKLILEIILDIKFAAERQLGFLLGTERMHVRIVVAFVRILHLDWSTVVEIAHWHMADEQFSQKDVEDLLQHMPHQEPLVDISGFEEWYNSQAMVVADQAEQPGSSWF